MTGLGLKKTIIAAVFLAGWALTATPAHAACNNPPGTKADIIYNSSEKVFQYCNDSDWIGMNMPGSGAGGCLNPALNEGQLVYNEDYRVVQGCAGSTHMAMGPIGGIIRWTKISRGSSSSHTCGIKSDGSLWCWGTDANGRLGDDVTLASQSSPVAIAGTWLDVATGQNHTCGIKSDRSLWCWGGDAGGQIGNGATTGDQPVPVAIAAGQEWKSVSAGISYTCGIKMDNSLWCWGLDSNGKLGNGADGNQIDPDEIAAGEEWLSISAGENHACGIKIDESLWCWGSDGSGNLGNGAGGSQTSPAATAAGEEWSHVSAGGNHTCGIKTDGSLWCWGADGSLQVGNGLPGGNEQSPVEIAMGETWVAVAAGTLHTCGIKSDETMWCWGNDSSGQLGNGLELFSQHSPAAIDGAYEWSFLTTGTGHTCGIEKDGTLSCWGSDFSFQLGNGSANADTGIPTKIASGTTWREIAAGTNLSCGIKLSDNSLWCWGADTNGSLGNGASTGARPTPTHIEPGQSWLKVATAISANPHACAIKTDDSLWCWGADTIGQIGNGATTGDIETPTEIAAGENWSEISVGGNNSCGIKTNGSLWCWGSDSSGQIGNGAATGTVIAPEAIAVGETWSRVSVGQAYVCAIKTDGSLWCWGNDSFDKLGNGADGDQNAPDEIAAGETWTSISAGSLHSCGIKTDGSLWCWGSDTLGQLGNGAGGASDIPVEVPMPGNWLHVAVGNGSTCGVKVDFSHYCWGSNSNGKLGIGTVGGANVESPALVLGGGSWRATEIGDSHACAIASNNTLYCWGAVTGGGVGNGVTSISTLAYPIDVCGSEIRHGTFIYNEDFDVMQYCDGAGWVQIGVLP